MAMPGVAELHEPDIVARLDANPRRLHVAAALALAVGGVVWWAGWLVLHGLGWSTHNWDAVWGLAGVSFLSSVAVPIPGVTATLLLALSVNFVLGTFAVLGAAFGGTIGAALLHGLGQTGREALRNRATRSAWSRKTLAWSRRMAVKWTYLGVAALLVPQFIPKLVVLYAAVLAELKIVPFLGAVFVGVFLRNLVVLGFFSLFTH